VKPLSDRAIDRGIQALDGSGVFDMMMKPVMTDRMVMKPAVMPNKNNLQYFTPEELIKYGYKGSGVKKRGRPRKGMGMFDFLDPKKNGADRFFTQTLPNTLVDEGIPIVAGVAGSTLGSATGNPLLGLAGSMAGKELGKEASRRIRKAQGRGLADLAMEVGKQVAKKVAKKVISVGAKKARQGSKYLIDRAESLGNELVGEGIYPANTGSGIYPAGVNLRKGSGMNAPPIQLGSPYLQRGSAGWNPYIPSQNPFTTNTMVGRATKGSGMIVRV